MPTPNLTIQIAELSQAYALIEIQKRGLDGGGIDLKLPRKLYNIRKSVQWLYDLNPSNTTLQGTANYLYALCAPFNLKAQYVISQGSGGTIAPITPIASPIPIEFIVSVSSPIVTGDSVLLITSFIGYNLLFIRNNIPQSQINDGGTYFTWNKTTGSFECFGIGSEGELFQLYPYM